MESIIHPTSQMMKNLEYCPGLIQSNFEHLLSRFGTIYLKTDDQMLNATLKSKMRNH